jgi:FKBP-type peptidyl-prolyl cis-trans isomerase
MIRRQYAAIATAFLLVTIAGCADRQEEVATEPSQIPAPANVAQPPADATVTESGLAYIILEQGAGAASPTVADEVTVHYTGWTTDGRMFDSSVARGEPNTFSLGGLIAGWQEGITLMSEGDRYRFWIPGHLAYDNSQRADAPRGTLVFDVELIAVHSAGGSQP